MKIIFIECHKRLKFDYRNWRLFYIVYIHTCACWGGFRMCTYNMATLPPTLHACTDLFAIPDFAAGAMENWGLITYRETAILYDPESTSSAEKQWIAVVVSHELAHQVTVSVL